MSIANQLKSIDITKLKMSNGRTLAENLYSEANRLRDCIQNRLEIYLHTHPYRYGGTKPTYERTGGLENSLKVDDILSIRVVDNALEIFSDNEEVVVNGADGCVYKNVDNNTKQEFIKLQEEYIKKAEKEELFRGKATVTKDSNKKELYANIELHIISTLSSAL